MAGPMEQFVIKPIIPIEVGGVDLSFTNSSLYMLLAVVVSSLILGLCLTKRTLVPNVAQSFPECIYEFISGLIKENIGAEGLKYFSFIFCVFLFVAFGNLLGLFPYSFTFTSHLTAVGTLSLLALSLNIFVGIKKKKWGWLRTFLPRGIPVVMSVLIIPIEILLKKQLPF